MNKHRRLEMFFRHLGWLRNQAVAYMRDMYEEDGSTPSYYDLCKWLVGKRSDPRTAQWGTAMQRSIIARVRKGYDHFFRTHEGLPRFKNIDTGVHSFETEVAKPRSKGNKNYVQFKGLGRLSFTDTRGILDTTDVKVVRIVRNALRYEIHLVCEVQEGLKVVDKRPVLGIDLGVKAPVTLSNGVQYPPVKIDDTKRKRMQRKVSRAKKGSNGRNKAKALLSKESRRIAVKRRNAIHRMTTDVVRNQSPNLAIEELKVGNMTRKGGSRKRGLNRAMREQSLGIIATQLAYKAESAGGQLVRVAPHYTTQQCSQCLEMPSTKVELWQREYVCEHCGYVADRDVNAARNICRKGTPLHRAGLSSAGQTEADTSVSLASASTTMTQKRIVNRI